MAVIFISLFLALVLLYFVLSRSQRPGIVCLISGKATLLLLGLGFIGLLLPALLLQAAITFAIAFISILFVLWQSAGKTDFKPTGRFLLVGCIAAFFLSNGFSLWIGLSFLQKRNNFREKYPIASLANRLEYETKRPVTDDQRQDSTAPTQLADEIEERLKHIERFRSKQSERYFHRTSMLMNLHQRKLDDFVVSQGFGQTRMSDLAFHEDRLEKLKSVPFDDLHWRNSRPPVIHIAGQSPRQAQVLATHEEVVNHFVNVDRMGYVIDRDHVAGFTAHRFDEPPEPIDQTWRSVRLELISLLKHKVPVAYVSEELPSMDQLRDAPTRPLTDFERQALDRLQTEEDLVIDEAERPIRMVGSVRAAEDCLKCHAVKRGELWGAFTYEISPSR